MSNSAEEAYTASLMDAHDSLDLLQNGLVDLRAALNSGRISVALSSAKMLKGNALEAADAVMALYAIRASARHGDGG